ncbi:wax ester/triacylglycerol synthase domain-containing protein [Nonomuraea sp. NPDC047897]|uniref:wax ester/triacylglycerol synthase domain-containing protein n=1 Tax=Nonomuraea sp. NPDC047897 TaxID=3364346 RepID=UPI00371801DC
MRQLTALDAQFLHVECATTTAHVAGLAILDPADGSVSRESLAALLRERIHLSPALCLRLAPVPLGLDRPYWVAEPAPDIDDHLFETVLAAPGDHRRLAEEVARIHERRLDRTRPLWEMHLIRGLAGGLAAVYTKVHHAAIDGVSGAETLAALLDLGPIRPPGRPGGRRAAVAWTPGGAAEDGRRSGGEAGAGLGAGGMVAAAVLRSMTYPVRAVAAAVRTAGDLDAIPLVSTVPGAGLIARAARAVTRDQHSRPRLPRLAPPRTPLNGPISARRHLAFGSVPLKDVKKVARTHGVSVNDVVMTLCAAALRSWLAERDALPDEPLVVAVPVAVRGPRAGGGPGVPEPSGTREPPGGGQPADARQPSGAREAAGNQISVMAAPLPTDVADPVERLLRMGETMRAAKRRFALAPARWVGDLCSLLPAPVGALATPAIFRLTSVAFPPINLIISNVPGPPFPLYLCGGRVLSYYPLSVLTDLTGGVNITCFSYDGMLDFGVVACPERMDDVWGLLGHLQRALAELPAEDDARA